MKNYHEFDLWIYSISEIIGEVAPLGNIQPMELDDDCDDDFDNDLDPWGEEF